MTSVECDAMCNSLGILLNNYFDELWVVISPPCRRLDRFKLSAIYQAPIDQAVVRGQSDPDYYHMQTLASCHRVLLGVLC